MSEYLPPPSGVIRRGVIKRLQGDQAGYCFITTGAGDKDVFLPGRVIRDSFRRPPQHVELPPQGARAEFVLGLGIDGRPVASWVRVLA
jgi:cold shock CspA family protein